MKRCAYTTIELVLSILIGAATLAAVPGQDRGGQTRPQARSDQSRPGQPQFTDADRQTTRDWYDQHQAHPPAGLRPQDRLSPEQESRLQPGRPLDPDLRKREHAVPSDLSRRLPPPPPQHRYVAIGGHVGLIDSATQVLRDVIHLHQ